MNCLRKRQARKTWRLTRTVGYNTRSVNILDRLRQFEVKRQRYPMPLDVREAIIERGLMDAYEARPPYQRNDYIGWINNAKRDATRLKRLTQMLDELAAGDKYMNMAYSPKRSSQSR